MNKKITIDEVTALFDEVNKAKALVEEKITEAITAFMKHNFQRDKDRRYYKVQNNVGIMGIMAGILMYNPADGKVYLIDSVKNAHILAPITSLLLGALEDFLFDIQGEHGEFLDEDGD